MGFNIDLTNKEIRSFCEKETCAICPLYKMKDFCPITNPSRFYTALSSGRSLKNDNREES